MAVYDTPYYGQRRKALTGESYGPYYGMSLTGGGALPPEGRRALPPEISDKYQATGTPAITEGAEGVAQEGLESSMADTPGATWGQAAFVAGLPFGTPPPGTAQPKGFAKTALGVAPTVASKATGLPAFAWTQVVRNFISPLAAKAFPGLFTPGSVSSIPGIAFNTATNQFDIDRSITPLSQKAVFTGLPDLDISHDVGILESNAMGVMGPGTGGLGSPSGIGQGEGGAEGGY